MQEEPEEPIKINKNVPYAVNQIIMKALKKDPNNVLARVGYVYK